MQSVLHYSALVSTRDVSRRLRISQRRVRQLAATGRIPGATRPTGETGQWRFDPAAIERLIQERGDRAIFVPAERPAPRLAAREAATALRKLLGLR